MNLSLAPLQGFTDAAFRRVWQKHFTGIDEFYAPYITLQNDGRIKTSQWRDILPERNGILPIAQILPRSADEALALVAQLDDLGGYETINVNLGCPYPMVTRRGRGSGLLPHPEMIEEILEGLFQRYGDAYSFSVKCRCGLNDFDEQEAVFKVLNHFQLATIILHPRIAKQLYKGRASWSHFAEAKAMTDLPMVYNGDINSVDDYQQLMAEFPDLHGLMLGRGVLMNPLLPQEIKRGRLFSQDEKLVLFRAFVFDLIEENRHYLSGDSHLFSKIKSYLPYFEAYNYDQRKVFKKMKKAKSMSSFVAELQQFF